MKSDDSILGLFQDPLLCLIALILLGTLPVVLGSGTEDSLEGREVHQLQIQIERLQQELKKLDKQVEELRDELLSLVEELNALRAQEKRREEESIRLQDEINRLKAELAVTRSIIEKKQKELHALEIRRAAAKRGAAQAELLQELERKIRSLNFELGKKQALLDSIEKSLAQAEKEQKWAKDRNETQKRNIKRLEQELKIERQLGRDLEKKKEDLENALTKMGGMGQYTEEAVGDKSVTGFEAFGNNLLSIDNDNYDIEVLRKIYDGRIVGITKLTRKNAAMGEPPDAIVKKNSKFQLKLSDLDSKKNYIFFLVQKDSFDAFLKARQMAWNMGFVVGWQPFAGGAIYSGPGQGEGR